MEPISLERIIGLLGRWAVQRGTLHELLTTRLRQLIADGSLPPGALLPSDRALAGALVVGRNTVIAAYRTLGEEGWVERQQGSGTRVGTALLSAARTAAVESASPLFLHLLEPSDDAIQLTCASPWQPPPELVELQPVAAAKFGAVGADMGYHPAGVPELRQALADHYAKRGLPTSAEQILVTTGAQQALSLLVRLLVAPGDEVLLAAPTYPGAFELSKEAGARIRAVRADDGLDLEGYLRAVADRPALAYAITAFHNPTGELLTELQRTRLAETCLLHGVPLIDDEVLAELDLDGAAPPPLHGAINVGSLSKLVWGGLRVGWVRASEPVINRLARLKAMHDLGSAVFDQWLAAELLPRLGAVRERRTRELRASRDRLCEELAANLPWTFQVPSGGQTAWVALPHGDAGAFAQHALRFGVAVLPGQTMDPELRSGRSLRIPFVLPPDELSEAVRRMAEAWNSYDGTASVTALRAVVV
ncbi:PLP-dependent aminotransferase family protein [Saccharopolyspora indica]|uniref:aminotransferase-like domain-containing protein n=1 Tax=Saccharopolyspora indica TaxID=1229659 RepID=UPI0022EA4A7D|nr:PLP-dependent aminotransferase family protein [Saccharopolyspora indica]MDA3646035.1 PLP-dependent aminotransferase family protein [Saccharopolyspora indica]